MTAVDGPTTPTPAPAPKGSVWHRLYHGGTNFDFVGKRRIGFTISAVLIVVSAISLIFQGLNLGIDFEGGVAWEFQANGQTVDNARSVLVGQRHQPGRRQDPGPVRIERRAPPGPGRRPAADCPDRGQGGLRQGHRATSRT